MGIDVRTLGISKKYTDETVIGGGAIKGKNCTIDSITDITGGHRVTFKWTLDDGTEKTGYMDVMDGQDGQQGETGLGIKSVDVNSSNHVIVTYDDDTTEDAGEIDNVSTSFDKITDVDLDNLEDGQILKYNATTQKWENASAGSVDTNLGDLNDVDFSSVQDGQIIVWDATNSRWVNADNSASIDIDANPTSGSENAVSSGGTYTALNGKVDKVNGKGLSTNDYDDTAKGIVDGVTSALSNKVDKNGTDRLMTADEGTKLSGIAAGAEVNVIASITLNGTTVSPDANRVVALTVITKAVDDLENYYTKSTTYTKTEVDNLISALATVNLAVVQTLPTTNISTSTIYLVPKATEQTQNVYDEYICIDATTTPATWERIGDTEIDLSNYIQKSSTAGLVKNDGTIDTNSYATTSQIPSVTGKADKVTGATNGNFAGLDANGNLTDSGKKASDFATKMPSGGTTGQVLKKKSGTDYDVEWADESGGGSSLPSGKTATPIDSVSTWLACAGIDDVSYTTLQEVLADNSCLRILLSTKNACEYLVRCTGFVSTICADANAMSLISTNDNCANLLLTSQAWVAGFDASSYKNVIFTTSVPTMTSNTAPSGEAFASSEYDSRYSAFHAFDGNDTGNNYWCSFNAGTDEYIGYDFDAPVVVSKIEIMLQRANPGFNNGELQGSNDGITWVTVKAGIVLSGSVTTLTETNYNTERAFKKWRLMEKGNHSTYLSVYNLQFIGRTNVET